MITSFGQASTTFTGQNFGAGDTGRCRRVLWLCLALSLVLTAATRGGTQLFVRQTLGLFSADPEVVEVGVLRLLYVFSAYVFSIQVEVFSAHLRGFGLSALPGC